MTDTTTRTTPPGVVYQVEDGPHLEAPYLTVKPDDDYPFCAYVPGAHIDDNGRLVVDGQPVELDNTGAYRWTPLDLDATVDGLATPPCSHPVPDVYGRTRCGWCT